MNYSKIYFDIISRAKDRDLSGYKEKHHIIPKCVGGSDEENNLAYLTAREHFLCHWLLHEIYPNDTKILFAFDMMCKVKDKNQQRYIPSSKVVEYARIKSSAAKIGIKFSDERKLKISIATLGEKNGFFGKKHKIEHKAKMKVSRPSMIGDKNPAKRQEVRDKIRSKKIGVTIEKMTGKNHPFSKSVLQYDLQGNLIKEFESINLASKHTGIRSSGIRECCKGVYKQSGGYIWKYA